MFKKLTSMFSKGTDVAAVVAEVQETKMKGMRSVGVTVRMNGEEVDVYVLGTRRFGEVAKEARECFGLFVLLYELVKQGGTDGVYSLAQIVEAEKAFGTDFYKLLSLVSGKDVDFLQECAPSELLEFVVEFVRVNRLLEMVGMAKNLFGGFFQGGGATA